MVAAARISHVPAPLLLGLCALAGVRPGATWAPLLAAPRLAPAQALRFAEPPGCTTVRGEGEVALRVRLEHGLAEGECAHVSARSSREKVWYYTTPPTAFKDRFWRFCVQQGALSGEVRLPLGYARLSAWWDQADNSSEALTAEASVFVAVLPRGGVHGDLPSAARAARAEREDEVAERGRRAEELSAAYRPLARHPALAAASALGESGLLDARLREALLDGSPRALWAVLEAAGEPLGGGAAGAPDADAGLDTCAAGGPPSLRRRADVFRVPLFSPEVGAALVEEFAAALRSPLAGRFSDPNNLLAERRPGQAPPGLMLEELGLAALAESLVVDVLTPIARLLHPEWAAGFFDSYHAFTIHQRQAGFPWERRHAEDAVRNGNQHKMPRHTDVCEVSMNICLGANFTGSGIYFLGHTNSAGAPPQPVWVDNIPGTAIINLCQHYHSGVPVLSGERHAIVVRALSSEFEQAPAEAFAEKCMAGGAARALPFM